MYVFVSKNAESQDFTILTPKGPRPFFAQKQPKNAILLHSSKKKNYLF